ncbi:hypothetical protein MPER_01273, partial [Moniliophthora perniciosa FA553]
TVHPIQALGIFSTFAGLYMYNMRKSDVERGEKKIRRVKAAKEMMLPSTKADARMMAGDETPPPEFEEVGGTAETTGTGIGSNAAHLYGRPHHIHPPPPLSVQITPPNFSNVKISPTKESRSLHDSYPSPPPSLDSPPSQTVALGEARNGGFFQYDAKEHSYGQPLRTDTLS